MRKLLVILIVAAAATALLVSVVASAANGGAPLVATLLGANERPGPGDPDATGSATIKLNVGKGRICWQITVANVDPITAAHIHVAPVGSPGPIVVPLNPYTGGCTTVSRELIKAILQNPEAYYVNVHNATYPAGAARGQLSHPGQG